jgi:hypothetical protein
LIQRPPLLSLAALQKIDSLATGEAARFLELQRREFELYLETSRLNAEQQALDFQHLRIYRIISIISGTFLATGSLALCAFAVEKGANLVPIAAVLAPIAGIAGVFIWGYQPRRTDTKPHEIRPGLSTTTRRGVGQADIP